MLVVHYCNWEIMTNVLNITLENGNRLLTVLKKNYSTEPLFFYYPITVHLFRYGPDPLTISWWNYCIKLHSRHNPFDVARMNHWVGLYNCHCPFGARFSSMCPCIDQFVPHSRSVSQFCPLWEIGIGQEVQRPRTLHCLLRTWHVSLTVIRMCHIIFRSRVWPTLPSFM